MCALAARQVVKVRAASFANERKATMNDKTMDDAASLRAALTSSAKLFDEIRGFL